MSYYKITLPSTPNSSGFFDLEEISFDIKLRTLKTGKLCCDITMTTDSYTRTLAGTMCINQSPLLLSCPFKSRKGNIYFYDLYGNEDPTYDRLNERYLLIYDDEYKFEDEI